MESVGAADGMEHFLVAVVEQPGGARLAREEMVGELGSRHRGEVETVGWGSCQLQRFVTQSNVIV